MARSCEDCSDATGGVYNSVLDVDFESVGVIRQILNSNDLPFIEARAIWLRQIAPTSGVEGVTVIRAP